MFVQGQLKGQLTIAAANNVLITGNITYNGGTSGTSLLGLVANNFVHVRHPVQLQTTTYNPRADQPAVRRAARRATAPTTSQNSSSRYVQRICSENLTGVAEQPDDQRRDPRGEPQLHGAVLAARRRRSARSR